MEQVTVAVGGMTCGGCEQSVAKAIGRLPGVTAVTADHATGSVVIDAEQVLDRAAIRGAVEDAGYDLLPEDKKPLPLIG